MAKNKRPKGNVHLHQGTRQKSKLDICPRVSPAAYINDKSYWKNLVNEYGADRVMEMEGLTIKQLKRLAGETLTEFMHRPKPKKEVPPEEVKKADEEPQTDKP